jgi:hypothetical protein
LRPVMPASQGGVSMSRGDTGSDHSQTHIDNSKHSASHVHRHDTRSTTIIHNGDSDGRRHGSLWTGIVALVVTVLLLVARSLWFAGPATPPPIVVNVSQNVPVSVPGPPQTGTVQKTGPVPGAPNGNGDEVKPGPSVVPEPARNPAPSRRDTPPTPVAAPPPAPPKLEPSTFVNRGAVRPGAVSVLMVDSRRRFDAVLTQQVAELVDGTDGLFKPAFVQDGLFSRVHQGDIDLLRDLGISAEMDRVLLGTRTETFTPTEVAGQALVRASVTLNIRVVRPSAGFSSSPATATDIGAGFDQAGALALATENALKKLAKLVGR